MPRCFPRDLFPLGIVLNPCSDYFIIVMLPVAMNLGYKRDNNHEEFRKMKVKNQKK